MLFVVDHWWKGGEEFVFCYTRPFFLEKQWGAGVIRHLFPHSEHVHGGVWLDLYSFFYSFIRVTRALSADLFT